MGIFYEGFKMKIKVNEEPKEVKDCLYGYVDENYICQARCRLKDTYCELNFEDRCPYLESDCYDSIKK